MRQSLFRQSPGYVPYFGNPERKEAHPSHVPYCSLSVKAFIFVLKMSDASEEYTGNSISSDDTSFTSSNFELALRKSDLNEVLSQNADSKNDSLGSLCSTDEYPRVDIPVKDGNQCSVINYKLVTPGGKCFQYNGPFPPDPQLVEKLDAGDWTWEMQDTDDTN
ncbi:Lipoamide acyltransferase component of branched-chain alpha-keto acid dehydrogenase complex [Trichinella pseudospiralis]